MPYQYKRKVLQAAIISSLLYACESWLVESYKEVELMYIGALKALLGVRDTTRTDIVLIETGMPTLKEAVRQRQAVFMKKSISGDIEDTPLAKAYRTCQNKGTKGYCYIKNLLDVPRNVTQTETKVFHGPRNESDNVPSHQSRFTNSSSVQNKELPRRKETHHIYKIPFILPSTED